MVSSKRRSVPAIVAGALGMGGAFGLLGASTASAAEPTQQELLEQIKALQAKVEQMEARQQATQQSEQEGRQGSADTAVVDRTVADVLKDADERSQLLQVEGFTAGYSNGKFLIQSADGKFSLNPNLQLQIRYSANFRDGAKNIDSDDWQNGFEIRRAKLALEGNVFNKNTTYKFQWASNRSNGNLILEDAYVKHMFADDFMGGALKGFGIRAGQFKDFTFHEEILSSKRQLAADRSLVNEYLGGGVTDFEQGVTLIYDSDHYRAEGGFIDGANSDNTNFTNTGGGAATLGLPNPHYGLVARAEYKVSGNWKQYDDFTARGNKEDLLVVGAGVNWTGADGGSAVFHTVDVQWEPQAVAGLGLYAAYLGVYQEVHNPGPGAGENPYHFGFLAQAGYMLSQDWEVFARYDYTSLDDDAPGGAGTLGAAGAVSDNLHEFTIGLNYYLQGHAAKFTLDLSWLPNGSPLNQDGIGVLAQPNDEDQFVIRGQFQLLL